MPLVTIDGQPVQVDAGTLIIQAADQLGVEIPRFCYHPDLRPEGSCRMCLVQVKGYPRLAPACSTPVTDGMVVETPHRSVEAREAVRGVLELLLVNHPLDCPICDQSGECSLQDFYMHPDYGLHASQVDPGEKVRKRKALDLGPMVVLDSERCVMCSRCVRFSREVSGQGELEFVNRGNRVELQAFADRALQDPYAGNLADVCPVGALTSRPFRFKRRVWYLKSTPSICPGCSTGCNVRIDHFGGRIERVIPRRNTQVNASWMCDEGRMGYRQLEAQPRLVAPSLRRGDGPRAAAGWAEAVAAVASALRGPSPGPAAVIGSCSATNEVLWLLRRLAGQLGADTVLDARLGDEDQLVDVREDALLRRADKHANTRGAILLGMAGGEAGLDRALALAEAGSLGAAVVLYHPPAVRAEDPANLRRLQALVETAPFSAVLTSHEAAWWAGASAVLPLAAWGEEEGTYTNFAGQVQHAAAAFPPPGDARTALDALAELLAACGEALGDRRPEALFIACAREVDAYRGLTYATLSSRAATAYPPEGRMPYGWHAVARH